jgi:Holliday junction DNA helicase RuvB
MTEDAVVEVARCARGTPRVANRLLKRVRDFAQIKRISPVDVPAARQALDMEGIDEIGLDSLDRKYLEIIINFYDGGPVGIEAIAATLNEEDDTLADMVEPYLLKIGFVNRTSKGRRATPAAYEHLGIEPGGPRTAELF